MVADAVQSVTVRGVGAARRPPDVLRVEVAVQAQATTVDEAMGEANRAMEEVLAALRGAGVGPADLATTSLSLWPQHDRQGRVVTAYQAGNAVTATLRDVAAAGEVLAAVARAGGDATRLSGLRFDVSDDAAMLAEARREAVVDARRRAETYASAAGRALGEVLRIAEAEQVVPVPRAARMTAAAESAGPVPLEAGEHEVTAEVTVEWTLV